MAVRGLEITSRQPYEGGRAFGEAGAYERLDGSIHFTVEPLAPANAAIVDLEHAARDANGLVHFRADFCLLQPAEAERSSGRMLFEVANRGRKLAPRNLNHAPTEAVPTERIDPGDGFLLRRGWTLAWCGWQWDVVRSPALLGLEPPQALADGQPIEGSVLCEFQPNWLERDHLLANRAHLPYAAADLDDQQAVLLVRDTPRGPRSTIPRERWRFARDEDGRPVPDESRVWLEGGFEPGRIYELVYRTRTCPVVGTGLLAVRDCATFLRHGGQADGNPCAGRLRQSYGFGVSQSGRFLRDFLHLGLNLDEAGRQVFDGLLIHVAGARRGEFNQRYGQPSVQGTPGFGHRPPFAYDDQTGPDGARLPGLLHRQRSLGGLPKIVATNTSAEYWRGDCILSHADPQTGQDLELPAEVRSYLLAGTQHGLGVVPLHDFNPADGSRGANGFNAVDYSGLLRAALVNLDRWVAEGVEPPASVVPRLAEGTAVPPGQVLETYRRFPRVVVPETDLVPSLPRVDLGPDAERGIGRWPAEQGEPYPVYVAAVDEDGVEVAGLRLPDLTVPIASYTGWNARHPESGGPGQVIPMQGSTVPFARTAAERQRRGDPRRSVEERYADRDDYLARVRAAAEALVGQRHLLAEDVDLVVGLCAARYDALVGAQPSLAAAAPSAGS